MCKFTSSPTYESSCSSDSMPAVSKDVEVLVLEDSFERQLSASERKVYRRVVLAR